MESQFKNGALIDTRSEEKKAKDIQFKEIVASANPVVWTEKISTSWRKFPIFNQDGSGSCVAQTMAKIMGVLYYIKNSVYVHFSATHIYQRRSNKPAGGMAGVECFEIAKRGATLEVLTPSQDMTDTQMDGIKVEQYKEDVGKIFKIGEPIYGPVKDIETVASIIQTTEKAVMVWYYFTYPEWTDVPTVLGPVDLYAPGTVRHSVTAVDFTLYQGKKCLIIEDSWGPNLGKGGQRIITEDLLSLMKKAGCVGIEYGFESGNQKMLNIINKRVTVEQNRSAAMWTHEAGIFTSPALVLAMPGETNETVNETIEFLKSLNFHYKQYQWKYRRPLQDQEK